MTLRRSTAALAATLVIVLTGLGCSTSTPAASTCDDLQTLASEVRGLTSVDLLSSGVDGITAQTDKISKTLDDLKKSSNAEFGSDIDALKSSFSALKDTLTGVSSGSTSLTDVVSEVKADLSEDLRRLDEAGARRQGRARQLRPLGDLNVELNPFEVGETDRRRARLPGVRHETHQALHQLTEVRHPSDFGGDLGRPCRNHRVLEQPGDRLRYRRWGHVITSQHETHA